MKDIDKEIAYIVDHIVCRDGVWVMTINPVGDCKTFEEWSDRYDAIFDLFIKKHPEFLKQQGKTST